MRAVRRLRKCSIAGINIWMRSSLSMWEGYMEDLSIDIRASSKIKDSE